MYNLSLLRVHFTNIEANSTMQCDEVSPCGRYDVQN